MHKQLNLHVHPPPISDHLSKTPKFPSQNPACKESGVHAINYSPSLVDFAIGLVNFVINLPDRQVKFFGELKLQKNCEINPLIKNVLRLVEMMFGLVNVRFSFPEWQAETL